MSRYKKIKSCDPFAKKKPEVAERREMDLPPHGFSAPCKLASCSCPLKSRLLAMCPLSSALCQQILARAYALASSHSETNASRLRASTL